MIDVPRDSVRDVGKGGENGGAPSYLAMPLDGVLAAFADAGPAPGGGSAAVIAVALAAALCTMTARLSPDLAGADAMAAETQSIRDDLAPLCDEDPRTYLRVIAAHRSPPTPDPAARTNRITAALSEAAAMPMAVIEAGARLARLAAQLAEEGNPNLRGDAVAAAVLAGAGVEAAAALVRINLAGRPGDDRLVQARTLLDETGAWVERARRTVPA